MEQAIVILVFVAIAILNKVLRKGDTTDTGDFDKGSPPFTTEKPVRRLKADQTEEERIRKFMEALGVPAGSAIPPRKIERTQQPVRRVRPQVRIETPQQAPACATAPPPPLPQQPSQSPATYAEASSMPSGKSVVSAENIVVLPPTIKPAPAVDLQALLKTPASIRTAFVLKEILGPPRSLQSFSDAPSFP